MLPMTEPPHPDAAQSHAPIGELTDAECAWDRRLAAAGHSALGWRMLGRDHNGHLVAATTLPCGPMHQSSATAQQRSRPDALSTRRSDAREHRTEPTRRWHSTLSARIGTSAGADEPRWRPRR